MTENQKYIGKIIVVLLAAVGGWAIGLGNNWNAAFTPLAFGGLLVILGTQLAGIFGITSPATTQRTDLALLPGVHTLADVDQLQKTSPGTIPTPAEVADILSKPVPKVQ